MYPFFYYNLNILADMGQKFNNSPILMLVLMVHPNENETNIILTLFWAHYDGHFSLIFAL